MLADAATADERSVLLHMPVHPPVSTAEARTVSIPNRVDMTTETSPYKRLPASTL
eukprot:CAMPEP_0115142870 /NCGR_PEP_ID=MMETSP0227-20121206/60419_1 /TAXON_ID=89957 /ORGANISM="Polarella glacialis, Strain CCMP 1383" /LENGTH=54 /DNA_ID=CAMNT_0002551563 /DNA_START=438 /DNA_END=602 /DNA_ORIENTATION=-